jgi:DNA-binding CsgD family transcriptional regulator/tetratricopeptide (TPR) repeat protein
MGLGGSPPLLDRTPELSAIDVALSSAVSGKGSTLLVEGEAGIGKTRLLLEARERAADAGMTILSARAAEFEGGYAWGIVHQLFDPVLRADGGQLLRGDAAVLAGPVLSHGGRPGMEDAFSVLHGLYWLTVDVTQRAPLLLAVDDLHWSDQPSLNFISHLVRRLDGLPLLLVLTVREPRSATMQERLATASLAAETGVTVLRPSALGAAACAELVRAGLGADPAPEFLQACREATGGNPLLVNALLASLAAECVRGRADEVPRLFQLAPDAVSRCVLLQLGRMAPPALAAARAVAVLGTAATTGRVGRLTGLDEDVCAEAVGALMAERLVEGNRALRFVHPLVRSAVYQELAPPLRQRWHQKAARMLDGEGARAEEVAIHLLATGASGDGWVVDRLRNAAEDSRRRGAADVAALCLERALAEPPPAEVRGQVLFELGRVETMQAPASAVGLLIEALQLTKDEAERATIALALAAALALCGRFADAVGTLEAAIRETGDENSDLVTSLQAALLNAARWDLATRPVTRPLLDQIRARAAAGEELDPQLHANLAIELAAAGRDRARAVWHAREALGATPQLMSVASAALPETITVLLVADLASEARQWAHTWLQLAQQRGWPLSAAVAATVAVMIALYGGEVSDAVAYGPEATAGGRDEWVSMFGVAFLVPSMIERGDVDGALALLRSRDLTGELGATWPFNPVRHARGLLHAAVGDHAAALRDQLTAGDLAERWGIHNPAMMSWRSAAAISLAVLGDREEARRLCAEEIDLARRWGASRAVGVALRAAGVVEGGNIDQLSEAVTVLRGAPAPLELARALIDLGAAHRRAAARTRAREVLYEALDLAHSTGGIGLATLARQELVVAGGRPRRDAIRGRDALTPSELRIALLAAEGKTNRQIAQALFVTQRTVENHLTSAYGKLDIRSRPGLRAALADSRPSPR